VYVYTASSRISTVYSQTLRREYLAPMGSVSHSDTKQKQIMCPRQEMFHGNKDSCLKVLCFESFNTRKSCCSMCFDKLGGWIIGLFAISKFDAV
jgi:hypothetical protein